jgi:hypothetical protein
MPTTVSNEVLRDVTLRRLQSVMPEEYFVPNHLLDNHFFIRGGAVA